MSGTTTEFKGQVALVNAGHQLMVEAPEETLNAMVAFCQK